MVLRNLHIDQIDKFNENIINIKSNEMKWNENGIKNSNLMFKTPK